ncbi:hypothetical protein CR194_17030 [Salipaludibacillus keqinensis]|uniref:Spo0E family sporulation regulatory protein-aspartic acid phosphatase n=1 Tax=Salipaludibacillus keqinensis TaxID=2045207 RepID=A0A323TA89_9BACI|nr:aspartyl-phosphate phosphatase Spo0E family protein [Salipaludibacillus keqinensis]PYZ91906.1 hypothetical protein CR194_17030 [Salipaludibacillus keqinensis]
MTVKTHSMNELLQEIEQVRNRMNELSAHMQRTSKEVVELSTHLDKLLNEYQSQQINHHKNK